MKYMRQFGIILGVTCIGEVLKYFIPLPIPGSIYGLVLMLAFLMLGVIKLEKVKETGEFLIEIMPLMFIPAAVGLITSWEQLSSILVPVCVITVVTTFLVMIVTGKVTDLVIFRKKGEQRDESTHA
ncbi:CidA/LrgA family protein [Roseburia hominis]